MPDEVVGCGKPTGSAIGEKPDANETSQKELAAEKEGEMVIARVGGPAPDFTAPAYHKGKFINVKLSDYKGKWMLLCFYPGDFTFV